MNLEDYFTSFRKNIIGIDQTFISPFGKKKIVYADWIASGRIYKPIEDKLNNMIFPFVANTHTETSTTGATMSLAMNKAHKIIKEHVGANENDVLISAGAGMTMLINKFQRILGLKIHEKYIPIILAISHPIVPCVPTFRKLTFVLRAALSGVVQRIIEEESTVVSFSTRDFIRLVFFPPFG